MKDLQLLKKYFPTSLNNHSKHIRNLTINAISFFCIKDLLPYLLNGFPKEIEPAVQANFVSAILHLDKSEKTKASLQTIIQQRKMGPEVKSAIEKGMGPSPPSC